MYAIVLKLSTVCGCGIFQLSYQLMEWKGLITIEAEPPDLFIVAFETTKDGAPLTMVQ